MRDDEYNEIMGRLHRMHMASAPSPTRCRCPELEAALRWALRDARKNPAITHEGIDIASPWHTDGPETALYRNACDLVGIDPETGKAVK